MALNKEEALKELNTNVSDQTALVKKLMGPQIIKPKKYLIPGGKNLVEEVDQSTLPSAIYTWLRHVRNFTQVTISFCQDLSKRKVNRLKTIEFDPKNDPEWETRGKKWLAEQIANQMGNDFLLGVEVDKTGLYVLLDSKKDFSAESEDWEPYVELWPVKTAVF